MIYFIILILLIISSVLEMLTKRKNNMLTFLSLVVLIILNAIRYGVGSDYFNYLYLYNNIPKISEGGIFNSNIHGELGFKLSISLARELGINYIGYLIIISMIFFILLYRFLFKEAKMPSLSLLIFYSMYYFTYLNSGFRQGITILFFLTILLPLLIKKEYKKYIVYIFLLSMYHVGVLVCLVLLLIKFNWRSRVMAIATTVSLGIFLVSVLGQFNILVVIYKILGLSSTYSTIDISYFGILSRIAMGVFILILAHYDRDDLTDEDNQLLTYYFVGLLMYLVLSTQSLTSSRLHVYFKVLEVILIPRLLVNLDLKMRVVLSSFIIFLFMPLFYYKEIMAQIDQAELIGINSIIDYHYVSIFDKNEIYKYRIIPPHIWQYLE